MSAAVNPRLIGSDGPAAVGFDTFVNLVRAAVLGCQIRGCCCEPDIAVYAPAYVRIEHDDDCPALEGAA